MDTFEETARAITHAWMEHLGFLPDEVKSLEDTKHSELGCYFDGQDYDCTNQNGDSNHADLDTLFDVSEFVCFVLERSELGPFVERARIIQQLPYFAFSPIAEGGPRVMLDDVTGIVNGTRGVAQGGNKQ